ncbi:OmpA family protein [Alloalcanivorax gelatiniphagus]|uniref:OmpA family protein n=1 Tax=Alloalcanivorax gelatiniphagus TaxID=1194167 RepID=A0ABY2XL01_9GAMM|nr:OmpA family protein [Alloalcanivorax gelatiniphagus]TMW12836.1 OmpA family protein [Alloalcanivorax gelatiniphagus]|tara:strand:- start:24731 stop:25702 length:972 start_codon:yes stop_codon:yes gene_type:complete
MPSVKLCCLLGAAIGAGLAVLTSPVAHAADERADPRGWNASAMGVYVFEDQDRNDVDYGTGLRFGLGRQISEHWDLEWQGFGNSLERDRASGQHWQYGLGADALRYMYREGPSPYLLVGGGGVYTDSNRGTDTNAFVNAGAGLHFRDIWGSMGLRMELRYVLDFSDDGSGNEPFHDVRALVGLTFPLFGGGNYETRVIERERVVVKPVPMAPPEVLQGVNFEFDSARLTPNARTVLREVAERLRAYPNSEVEIGGHTDSTGSASYNQSLSERRAASVRDFLIDQGVDPGRLTAVGYGATRPVDDNRTEQGRERNRRIEMRRMN